MWSDASMLNNRISLSIVSMSSMGNNRWVNVKKDKRKRWVPASFLPTKWMWHTQWHWCWEHEKEAAVVGSHLQKFRPVCLLFYIQCCQFPLLPLLLSFWSLAQLSNSLWHWILLTCVLDYSALLVPPWRD